MPGAPTTSLIRDYRGSFHLQHRSTRERVPTRLRRFGPDAPLGGAGVYTQKRTQFTVHEIGTGPLGQTTDRRKPKIIRTRLCKLPRSTSVSAFSAVNPIRFLRSFAAPSGRINRQQNAEPGTARGLVFTADLTVVPLHDRAHDGETHAQTVRFA
jgi:hypothetical protein